MENSISIDCLGGQNPAGRQQMPIEDWCGTGIEVAGPAQRNLRLAINLRVTIKKMQLEVATNGTDSWYSGASTFLFLGSTITTCEFTGATLTVSVIAISSREFSRYPALLQTRAPGQRLH